MFVYLRDKPAAGWDAHFFSLRNLLQNMRERRMRNLALETLSDHRMRDLGLSGGRATPPRDPLRD